MNANGLSHQARRRRLRRSVEPAAFRRSGRLPGRRSRTRCSCSSTRRPSRAAGAPSEDEVHLPDAVDVELVETDRGGRSTYHAPGSAHLLSDPRPEPVRPRREGVLPEARGSGLRDAVPRSTSRARASTALPASGSRTARSPRSVSTSHAGSRPTASRSTSISTPGRSPTGSPPAASRTRSSRRWRSSSAGRSPSTR